MDLIHDGKLSPNFSFSELIATKHKDLLEVNRKYALQPEVLLNLWGLCNLVLQPIREAKGPITVSSGLRCPELNKLVGGEATSQHLFGQAADIVASNCSLPDLMGWVKSSGLPVGQCILERDREGREWVHISSPRFSKKNMEFLAAVFEPKAGRMVYAPWVA